MKRSIMYKAVVCFFSITIPLGATILHVPAQYPTIQQGLNAAQYGDTVLVAADIYYENIVWPSQDGIYLMSESGPGSTIIDGSSSGRVINFPNYSYSGATVVTGFTIQNGTAEKGAGIYLYGSPYIFGNIIQRNIAQGTSTWVYGGGIHCDGDGIPLIKSNLFTGNVARGEHWNYGGAIYVDNYVSPIIIGNAIEYDSTIGGYWNYGSGIFCNNESHPDIRHNVIRANVALQGQRGYGVGIFIRNHTNAYILSNLVYDNVANSDLYNYGAGVYLTDSTYFYNNTVDNNICTGGNNQYGGGIYILDSFNIVGDNIVTNNSSTHGGGIAAATLGDALLLNNDVWNNSPENYYNIAPGANDISVDPLFVTGPLGDYYLSQIAAGQTYDSPCLDYGFATADSLELDLFTTRTDTIHDTGICDLGYHYPTSPWIEIQEYAYYPVIPRQSIFMKVCPTVSNSCFTIQLVTRLNQNVNINLYDGSGRCVRPIYSGPASPVMKELTISIRDNIEFPSGVYFITAEFTDHTVATEKIVVTR